MTRTFPASAPWAGRADFEDLLRSLFGSDELRRWLTREPDLYDLRDALPGANTPLLDLVHRTTETLLHHGLLEDHLFDRLARDFPNRRSDIERVRATWHARPIPSAVPLPAPKFADPEMRRLTESLDAAYDRREAQLLALSDTSQVDQEILELRRRIRQGPQLKPGDYLHHRRFRLGDPIGVGGFASVWLAYDCETRERVAVKVLHGHKSSDPTSCERFRRGARNTANMRHPNIIKIVRTAFEDLGYHAYVMEYIAGGDLLGLAAREKLPEARLLEIFARLCDALAHAHERRFIHRDIKPSNILIDADGLPRLTDFDVMKSHDTTGGTRTGVGIGTVLYSAPETWNNADAADARSDIYSLGMTLLACLLREDVDHRVVFDLRGCLHAVEASPALKNLLARAIAREPAARPASAQELGRLLRDVPANGIVELPEPDTPSAELKRFEDNYKTYLASDRWNREVYRTAADHRSITLYLADICLIPAGALVCGISQDAGTGVLGASIVAAGGPAKVPGHHGDGPLPPGKVIVAPGGKLASEHVLYVVQDDSEAATGKHLPEQMQRIVRRTLEVADALHLRSIAYPLLLTGVVGLPRDVILRLLFEALYTALGATTHVEMAFIAIYPYAQAITQHLPPPSVVDPAPDGRPQFEFAVLSAPRDQPPLPLPRQLASNTRVSFPGAKIVGAGFLLSADERAALIAKNAHNAARIFPYLAASDVKFGLDQRPERYIINFYGMRLVEASQWPDLLQIVREHVKSERDAQVDDRLRRHWWQFVSTPSPLYDRLLAGRRCIVSPQVSRDPFFATCASAQIFASDLFVHASESMAFFACVQSRIFAVWYRMLASKTGAEYRWDLEAFNTFPFPFKDPQAGNSELAGIGAGLEAERQIFMRAGSYSLQQTYTSLKDRARDSPGLLALRARHVELDEHVLSAYDWTDIEVPPWTKPHTAGEKAAVQAFESAVLTRLSALNQVR